MATAAAARSVFRTAASRFASTAKPSPSPFRSLNSKPLSSRLLRSPVQLSACLGTMQPFHTVTATALLTSMLSVSPSGYAWLEACKDDA